MGCLLGKQDINDIHPDIFSVHNIDNEVCLLFYILKYKGGLTSEGILSGAKRFRTFFCGWDQIENMYLSIKPARQIILRSKVLCHHFYLPKVIIQVQNGNEVVNRVVLCLKCMELAY